MAAVGGNIRGGEIALASSRRNVYLLTGAQAVLGAMGPIVFSVGGVAGYQLLGADKSMATAPLTGFNIGVAIGAICVALLSRLLGRQAAFIVGALLGAAGGLLAAYALYRSDFWLFAISLLVTGLSGGFTQKLRFAAADASPGFYKPRAISWILAGGMVSAVLGPQLVIQTRDMLAPVFFAGAFLAVVPVCLVAIVFLALLKLPDQRPAVHAASSQDRPVRVLSTVAFGSGFA